MTAKPRVGQRRLSTFSDLQHFEGRDRLGGPCLGAAVGGLLRGRGGPPSITSTPGERRHAEGVVRFSVGPAGAGFGAAEPGYAPPLPAGPPRRGGPPGDDDHGGPLGEQRRRRGGLGGGVLLGGVRGQGLHAAHRCAAGAAAHGVAYTGTRGR